MTFEASIKIVVVVIFGSRNQRNDTFVQHHKNSILQNELLETFICIRIDAECDENALAISFGRMHDDFHISARMTSNVVSVALEIVELEKNQRHIWNQRPLQRSRPLWTFSF